MDLDALASLVAAGRLAAGGQDWIASLDVNPLLFGQTGSRPWTPCSWCGPRKPNLTIVASPGRIEAVGVAIS
jgi:hypothetical protein